MVGWSPEQFWKATPRELQAAVAGWKEANVPKDEKENPFEGMDDEEIDEMLVEAQRLFDMPDK